MKHRGLLLFLWALPIFLIGFTVSFFDKQEGLYVSLEKARADVPAPPEQGGGGQGEGASGGQGECQGESQGEGQGECQGEGF